MPIYGGTSMNERDLQVLEQYPFSVNASWRVRGAFLLDSSEGRLLIREFSGSAAKVEKEQQGYQQAAEHHGQGTCPHIPAFKGAGEQLGKQIPGLEPDPQAEAGEEP